MIADGTAPAALPSQLPQSRPIRSRLALTIAGFGALAIASCVVAPLVGSSSISLRRALDSSIPFASNVDAQILFIARHYTYFRNYDAALRTLARDGHSIHLAVEKDAAIGGRHAVDALAREHPGITVGMVPAATVDVWSQVARRLRIDRRPVPVDGGPTPGPEQENIPGRIHVPIVPLTTADTFPGSYSKLP